MKLNRLTFFKRLAVGLAAVIPTLKALAFKPSRTIIADSGETFNESDLKNILGELYAMPKNPRTELEIHCSEETFKKIQEPSTRMWIDYEKGIIHFCEPFKDAGDFEPCVMIGSP